MALEPWEDELKGKVVLVTGASAGIGREFCLDLANAGCKIIAAARRVDRLQSLCDQINNLSSSSSSSSSSESNPTSSSSLRAVALELDVSADGPTIEKSIQKGWEAFGHIDALVNNAGVRGFVSLNVKVKTFFFLFFFFQITKLSQFKLWHFKYGMIV